jgi:hypothetical protein
MLGGLGSRYIFGRMETSADVGSLHVRGRQAAVAADRRAIEPSIE